MPCGGPGSGMHLYSDSQDPRTMGQALKLRKHKLEMNELFLSNRAVEKILDLNFSKNGAG